MAIQSLDIRNEKPKGFFYPNEDNHALIYMIAVTKQADVEKYAKRIAQLIENALENATLTQRKVAIRSRGPHPYLTLIPAIEAIQSFLARHSQDRPEKLPIRINLYTCIVKPEKYDASISIEIESDEPLFDYAFHEAFLSWNLPKDRNKRYEVNHNIINNQDYNFHLSDNALWLRGNNNSRLAINYADWSLKQLILTVFKLCGDEEDKTINLIVNSPNCKVLSKKIIDALKIACTQYTLIQSFKLRLFTRKHEPNLPRGLTILKKSDVSKLQNQEDFEEIYYDTKDHCVSLENIHFISPTGLWTRFYLSKLKEDGCSEQVKSYLQALCKDKENKLLVALISAPLSDKEDPRIKKLIEEFKLQLEERNNVAKAQNNPRPLKLIIIEDAILNKLGLDVNGDEIPTVVSFCIGGVSEMLKKLILTQSKSASPAMFS